MAARETNTGELASPWSVCVGGILIWCNQRKQENVQVFSVYENLKKKNYLLGQKEIYDKTGAFTNLEKRNPSPVK